jgi:hypothetical protein
LQAISPEPGEVRLSHLTIYFDADRFSYPTGAARNGGATLPAVDALVRTGEHHRTIPAALFTQVEKSPGPQVQKRLRISDWTSSNFNRHCQTDGILLAGLPVHRYLSRHHDTAGFSLRQRRLATQGKNACNDQARRPTAIDHASELLVGHVAKHRKRMSSIIEKISRGKIIEIMMHGVTDISANRYEPLIRRVDMHDNVAMTTVRVHLARNFKINSRSEVRIIAANDVTDLRADLIKSEAPERHAAVVI